MIPLFLPVCSPKQPRVYQSVQRGLGLAARKRQLMLAVPITSLLRVLFFYFLFFRGWGQSVATQENTAESNTE